MDDSQVTNTVLATYRQIAEHFQLLSGPDAGRKKATRAGWPVEPQNHPLDPVHVRVPRDVWDTGPDRPRQPADKLAHHSDNHQPVTPDKSRMNKVLDGEATALREALARERERADRAEIRSVVLEAERAAAQTEVADLRERIGRAEGELDGVKLATEHQHNELARMRQEVAEAHNRAVVAEQAIIEATRQREGAEAALAGIRRWTPWNFLLGRAGRGRR